MFALIPQNKKLLYMRINTTDRISVSYIRACLLRFGKYVPFSQFPFRIIIISRPLIICHHHLHGLDHAWSVPSSWKICRSLKINYGRPMFRCIFVLCVKLFFGIRPSSIRRTWSFHCDLDFKILLLTYIRSVQPFPNFSTPHFVLPCLACCTAQEFHFCRFHFFFLFCLL